MNQFAKTFTLSACALAASVLISACGGAGGAADTTPPSVVISSAAGTAGAVTFTFTFSEALKAGTFVVEDISVSGGTAGALTMVDATHYTLVVMPTTGAISATVGAYKYSDLGNIENTASATATYAPVAIDFSGTAIKLNAFGRMSGVISDDPVIGASNKVAKFVKGPSNEVWAGVTIYDQGDLASGTEAAAKIYLDAFDLATNKVVTLRSYTSAPVGTIMSLKLEDSNNGNANIVALAATTVQNAWETLRFNFTTPAAGVYSASTTYNTASVFPAFSIPATSNPALASDTTFYFDDLSYTKATGAPAAVAPTTASTAPTALAGDVISVFSNAYTNVAMSTFRTDWSEGVLSDLQIAGNDVKKYAAVNFVGMEPVNQINLTGYDYVSFDAWSPDFTQLGLKLVDFGANGTYDGGDDASSSVLVTPLNKGVWNTYKIPLTSFTTLTTKAHLAQILFVTNEVTNPPTAAPASVFIDNLYFGKNSVAPAAGCTGPACVDFSAVGIGFGPFENGGGGTVEIANDPTNAANKAVKFVKKAGDPDYFGTTITGLGGSVVLTPTAKTVTMRVWSPSAGTNFLLKFEGGSGGPAQIEKDMVTTKAGEWETLSFVMTDAGTYTTVVVFPNGRSKVASDKTMYIDDLTFPAFVASGSDSGGGGAIATEMGAGGLQALTVAAADVKTGDGGNTMFVAGEGIFAVNYVGSAETTAPFNLAAWPGAKTANFTGITGVAGGSIGYFQDDVNLSTSTQKVDEGGWVSGTAIGPNGVPNFFRYFVLKGAVSANAYMGLYANAPNNGFVNTSSFSKIKFKVWGPGPMFERANFTPVIEMTLTGPKVANCTTGSGGTEITQTFSANLRNGAGGAFTLPFSGFTVKGLCGTDTNTNAVANVRANLARVVVTVPGTSFNYTNLDGGNYATGVNLGPIGFTNN
jgi:hypothetical protein